MILPCGLFAPGIGLDLWSFLRNSSVVVMNGSWFWSGSVRWIGVVGGKGREMESENGGGEGMSIGLGWCWRRSDAAARVNAGRQREQAGLRPTWPQSTHKQLVGVFSASASVGAGLCMYLVPSIDGFPRGEATMNSRLGKVLLFGVLPVS